MSYKLFFRGFFGYLNLQLFQGCFQNRFKTLTYSESEVY